MTTLQSVEHTLDEIETPPEPTAERRPARPRYSPGRVDESKRSFERRRALRMLLVAVLALTDVMLIKSTWDVVLLLDAWISWATAVLTALAGACLMWSAGHQAALRRAYGARRAAVGVLVLAWLLVGTGLWFLRWSSGDLTTPTLDVEGGAGTGTGPDVHHVLALALLALYVAPGLLAFRDAADLGNPIAAHQRLSHASSDELSRRLEMLEGEVVQSNQLLARAGDEFQLIDVRAAHSKEAHQALAAELKAHARAEILRWIADPAAGGITAPDDHGARAEATGVA
jgi:hypothetical protein